MTEEIARGTSSTSETGEGAVIAVYLVTYRRHEMLRRSLASVLAQTHRNVRIHVINDDPDDPEVGHIVAAAADSRAALFEPVAKRGATGSFGLVFEETAAEYVAMLEDDNWWEPAFLQSQVAVLENHAHALATVGNERIWREEHDGTWTNTGQTIWPFSEVREHRYTLESLCGGATYCNSSALIRVNRSHRMTVPNSIPVDVTEHFRDRTMLDTILLNGAPLTNYAETIKTARDTTGRRWSHYQQVLIGSCFVALQSQKSRKALARNLWHDIDSPTSPRAVSLILAGLATKEARALLWQAPLVALARGILTVVRRTGSLVKLQPQGPMAEAMAFLVGAPLTQSIANRADDVAQEARAVAAVGTSGR
jgi:glycosyltransferase involved in cell wall biosynthesis